MRSGKEGFGRQALCVLINCPVKCLQAAMAKGASAAPCNVCLHPLLLEKQLCAAHSRGQAGHDRACKPSPRKTAHAIHSQAKDPQLPAHELHLWRLPKLPLQPSLPLVRL